MNKLDYIDAIKFHGTGTVSDIFQELGRISEPEVFVDEKNQVELKATTVRVPVDLLESFDAVLAHFGVSRQDAFAHMLYQFIGDSVAGYVFGKCSSCAHAGIDESLTFFNQIIDSLPPEHQQGVRTIAAHALNMKLGGEYAQA